MEKILPTCSVDGCESPVRCKALCTKHYFRMRNHGDVHYAKHIFGDPKRSFWAKVDKSGECWNWTASINPWGYGMFQMDGKSWPVHRLAYTWLVGPIPKGAKIDHICHNRACVRPEHLRPATQKQNGENRSPNTIKGKRGAYRMSPTRWRAKVTHNYQSIHVGYFATEEEAAAAAAAKRNELFTHNDLDRKTA
jgi:hypothetical protein